MAEVVTERQQSLHLILFTPKEVAEELTLRDSEMLRRISPDEIRHGAWMHNDKEKLAPNIMAMVKAFNSLAQLVTTEILAEECQHNRAKLIVAYIKIAKKCYEMRNYNSLSAVLAGLLCTPIYRLGKTWREVPSKRRRQFGYLKKVMSEEGGWVAYKKEITRHMAENTHFIIFLGVFLSHVVRYESYRQLKRTSRSASNTITPHMLPECKISETFTVLEAITVRNRLKSLRRSQQGRKSREVTTERSISQTSQVDMILLESGRGQGSRRNTMPIITYTESFIDDNGLLLRDERLNVLSDIDESESNRDELSPDLPDCSRWSLDHCCETDRRRVSTSSESELVESIRSLGRSLEQLLQACLSDDIGPYRARSNAFCNCMSLSQSTPSLLSGSELQTWDDTTLQGQDESTQRQSLIHDSGLGIELGTSDKENGLSQNQKLEKRKEEDQISDSLVDNDLQKELKTSTEDREGISFIIHEDSLSQMSSTSLSNDEHMKISSTFPNDAHQKISGIFPNDAHHKRSATYPNIPIPRKRYTASDEMDVLLLQIARDEPSSDPIILLKQYQVLSLKYQLTSSPYIRAVLDNGHTTSDTLNYRQSYLLEAL